MLAIREFGSEIHAPNVGVARGAARRTECVVAPRAGWKVVHARMHHRSDDVHGDTRRRDGVERCFAMQAGRDVRVMVKPGEVNDDMAALLAREIAQEIEDSLEYPGQIKVTVIRESRTSELAR